MEYNRLLNVDKKDLVYLVTKVKDTGTHAPILFSAVQSKL